jgi:glycosyltransferase involved in cell wall biosynthesis
LIPALGNIFFVGPASNNEERNAMQQSGSLTAQTTELVSVIIPCYNGERFLPESIESLLAQTYNQFEIIVIDDGSTDESANIIARYPDIRYVYQENQGVAKARNRGYRESRGRYLVFLDQDDRLLPKALETNLHYLKKFPQCAFVFGFCSRIRAKGSRMLLQLDRRPVKEEDYYQALLSGGRVVHKLCPPSVAMFHRHVFEAVGGFDVDAAPADDYDIYLRIAREFQIYCHNTIVAEYRIHGSNQGMDAALMSEACLRVLDAQWKHIRGIKRYEAAYKTGKSYWPKYWARMAPLIALFQAGHGNFRAAAKNWQMFLRYLLQRV